MLGTAFPAARVLLIEQPGPWGRHALTESHLDPSVAQALIDRANRHGIRILTIRRPGRAAQASRRAWGLADCRPGQAQLRWGTFGPDAELLDLTLDGSDGTPASRPSYFVCAHSKHDACCALRGRPVAAALHEERPDQVWECSHANVLVLPDGLLYGRVLPYAAPEFVAAVDAGEVIGALLRGRVGLPSVAQAALAYAFDHLAIRDAKAITVEQVGVLQDGVAVVRLSGPHGPLQVTVQIEKVAADGLTCSNPGGGSYLSYRPLSVVAG
jgi:hypothetical protein